MQQSEWFVSVVVAPRDRSSFDDSDAEALWSLIIEWAERRSLGIGGSYRPEGEGFLYQYGVCATDEERLIDEVEIKQLLESISAAVSARGDLSSEYRPFTGEESDPVEFDRLVERVRKSIN